MKYKLGLDMGIASVGWAVVDEKGTVIESGVRLFDSADANKNVERRTFRGARRLVRRRKHRVERLKRLLAKYGIKEHNNTEIDPLIARNKGLNEKLTSEEFYSALLYLVRRRGISYLDEAADDTDGKGTDYQKSLKINEALLKEMFPCQIQMERLEKYGAFRGETVAEEDVLSNVFTTSAFKKEADAILEKQSEFYDFINDDFKDEFKKIHLVKREYFVGPGNEASRTNYGRFKVSGKTVDNIFETLIGKCTMYPEELRASGASYTAQEFNLLNDLNNFTINGEKLSTKQKHEIIELFKNEKTKAIGFSKYKKIVEKVIGEDINSFENVKIDYKTDKEVLHTLEKYRGFKIYLEKNEYSINDFSREDLDKIAHILTINTERDGIIRSFKAIFEDRYSNEFIELLYTFRKSNSSYYNKWHSLSLKAMNEIMQELYETPKNQMQIFTELGLFKSKVSKYEKIKNLDSKIFTDELLSEIYNPIVKRSANQTIKVIAKVIKKYGYPKDIILELAREKNSYEKRRNIEKYQKKNRDELQKITDELAELGVFIEDKHYKNNKNLALKLKMWKAQDGKCLYSGKTINPSDLVNDQEKFDIDHIIPISISFDDSQNNKVLVYYSENRKKGNLTPYAYLKGLGREWDYKAYKAVVTELYKTKKTISRRKAKNLLFEGDITKQEVLEGFISRNLNDTRYASKVVLNALQDFMKAKDVNTKIKVLNGSFTNQLRKKLKLDKNREESYSHHAVDAMILCFAKSVLDRYNQFKIDENVFNPETGEILDEKKFKEQESDIYKNLLFYEKLMEVQLEIARAEKEVKFSHKVDKKPNRAVGQQTIYSSRLVDDKYMKVAKYSNIYDEQKYVKNIKARIEKNPEHFLMYIHDKATWEYLMDIIKHYKDAKNPFLEYKKEYGPIRKISKRNNGPEIFNLKYYDGEVGSCIDITKNCQNISVNKDGKSMRKVFLTGLKPFRSDVYYNKQTKRYHIVGLKYSDLKFNKGNYNISIDKYIELLVNEKVIDKKIENLSELNVLGIVFKFSLYKNDILEYEKNGELYTERFLSRTKPAQLNNIETKTIDGSNFINYEKNGEPKRDAKDEIVFKKQNINALLKTTSMRKINVDILGNHHYIDFEKFSLKITLDNEMIK